MTVQLYYQDPYLKEFTADVAGVVEKEDGFHVELDQTAFFPVGGGQPSDTGSIDGIEVVQVYPEGERVIHVLRRPPAGRTGVVCRIDWERRFDHMQQHLGQHLLSAVLENRCGAETIGFHLGRESSTIDIDRELEAEAIKAAEPEANQAVFDNLPVRALYPTPEEIAGLTLRKPPPVQEQVRLIEIGRLDLNPCCGTHPRSTGEVGLIKVCRFERYKGGLRLEFLCGRRALRDYTLKNEVLGRIAAGMSVREADAAAAVEGLRQELASRRKENQQLEELLLQHEAEKLLERAEDTGGARIIMYTFHGRDFDQVKRLAARTAEFPGVVLLFGAVREGRVQMIFSRSGDLQNLSMSEILKGTVSFIDGRGGGSAAAAQGGGNKEEGLALALAAALARVKEVLNKGSGITDA
ncbi:MAG: alanyl-tRNA editing protein [Firmicutes bacterium]|nr:alanyl-tRNA editing protein [Bacillota bacterium]